MDKKIAENLMMTESEKGREYRDYILNLSENQQAAALGIDIFPEFDEFEEDEQMTTVEELNVNYGLAVGAMAIAAHQSEDLDLHGVLTFYLKTPEDYIDALCGWGTMPTQEATEEFLSQFYNKDDKEQILNRYVWSFE
ncbi:hypothetical protein [Paenibacillus xylanexedens]|uniref:hypothetical protein n=1 Tax=Paenibacillus xylanexedens TaxID=528191 RepID=UPI000F521FC5|nr:hypothetical protein [Paenibacillus xylanexedens]RPK29387.1 hypothetical protein EDO6_00010 [Paenibacillus xylanexedens]